MPPVHHRSLTRGPAMSLRSGRIHPSGRRAHRQPPQVVLRFCATAWAKLVYLRDYDCTEVGGFGISAAEDLLSVEDVQLVKQTCTPLSVMLDDEAVSAYFDQQVDAGRRPQCFGRIWIHTHPGDCPRPSSTDEEAFARAFGRTDWAVMFILARSGRSYARIRFGAGPGGQMRIGVGVDYRRAFAASDFAAWEQQYLAHVTADLPEWVRRDHRHQ